MIVEDRLEGKFTKYNNNGGGVMHVSADGFDVNNVPQCFSHFTWSVSDGDKMLCDLQVGQAAQLGLPGVGRGWDVPAARREVCWWQWPPLFSLGLTSSLSRTR